VRGARGGRAGRAPRGRRGGGGGAAPRRPRARQRLDRRMRSPPVPLNFLGVKLGRANLLRRGLIVDVRREGERGGDDDLVAQGGRGELDRRQGLGADRRVGVGQRPAGDGDDVPAGLHEPRPDFFLFLV